MQVSNTDSLRACVCRGVHPRCGQGCAVIVKIESVRGCFVDFGDSLGAYVCRAQTFHMQGSMTGSQRVCECREHQ